MKLLKGTFVLKIVALIFAVLGYFYIQNEIANSEKKTTDPSYKLIKLTAKTLPVKLRLETSAPWDIVLLTTKSRRRLRK